MSGVGSAFRKRSISFSLDITLMLSFVFPLKFGTRLIIEAMEAAGHSISTLFLCGGLSKNPLFVQMHADITGKSGEARRSPWAWQQRVVSVIQAGLRIGGYGWYAKLFQMCTRLTCIF